MNAADAPSPTPQNPVDPTPEHIACDGDVGFPARQDSSAPTFAADPAPILTDLESWRGRPFLADLVPLLLRHLAGASEFDGGTGVDDQ